MTDILNSSTKGPQTISFPKNEHTAYLKRLCEGKIIYTTRVSSEVGKYKMGNIYNSPFGKLKVVSLEHFENILQHPFYDELSYQQIVEISYYVAEGGFDVIGLIRI